MEKGGVSIMPVEYDKTAKRDGANHPAEYQTAMGLLRTSEVVLAVSANAALKKAELLEADRLSRRQNQRAELLERQRRFDLRRVSR